ncbi:MAG: type I-E CRISPR-associated protein Cse1/CasA [Candidatus Riflebacteria bacterium]|nr:type I-E CRISPR-associated protein Cse1/CasA [Candidatus Riflebacteria bacterium]
MPNVCHNCLREPLFNVRTKSGKKLLSLPQILENLGTNSIEAFSNLQKHQEHAWHAFLVQLSAIALHRSGKSDPRQSMGDWTNMLLDLTKHQEEPWSLIVEDLDKPAFFQPPVPEGNLKNFKNEFSFPDDLDILITAKNHDVKSTRLSHSQLDHWIYALIALQTMQGFLGAGNYGIARMNGGYANRPGISLLQNFNLGDRYQRETKALLQFRATILSAFSYPEKGGKHLLWLDSWEGQTSFSLTELDPFFIEICRRVRFRLTDVSMIVCVSSTRAARINAKESTGNTGDPWTPVERDSSKALTIPKNGFSYERVQEILFEGKFAPGVAQQVLRDDPEEMIFLANAMTRGQGKTEGFHERLVKIPAKIRRSLISSTEKSRLGAMAKKRIEIVENIQKKILKPALCALIQSGGEKLDFTDSRPQYWIGQLDTSVDQIFFEHLWQDITMEAGEANLQWAKTVLGLAQQQLNKAMASVPFSSVRKYRSICAAERVFYGSQRRLFPELNSKKEEIV